MDLLTIACDRDFYMMDTQARSIQKFVAPCTHWVFVNNTRKSKKDWEDLLNPYYINHKLELIFTDDIKQFDGVDGYNTQQYWKLTAIDFIKSDHIIIDSKNVFIRETNLNDWCHEGTGVHGHFPEGYTGSDDPIDNAVLRARDYYANYYGLPKIKKFFTISTPFVVRQSVMEEVSALVKQDNVFVQGTDLPWHADFMLYSMIGEKYGVLDKPEDNHLPGDVNSRTIFYHRADWNNNACKDGIQRLTENINYSCVSIHRTWIDNAIIEERTEMLRFLESLGVLQNKLKIVLEKGNTDET